VALTPMLAGQVFFVRRRRYNGTPANEISIDYTGGAYAWPLGRGTCPPGRWNYQLARVLWPTDYSSVAVAFQRPSLCPM